MLAFSLNPRSDIPLVEQVVAAISAQIEDRVLRAGARLPAIRQLANQHQISRFTVVEAYDRLVAKGYLQSRRGSGFYVQTPREAPDPLPCSKPEIDKITDAAWLCRRALEAGPDSLRASAGWLPASWLDQEELSRHLRSILRSADTNLVSYGSPMGYEPLRRYMPQRLAEFGIHVSAAQILLTQGATHALDLIARCFLRPGDTVLVDDPGYGTLFANLRLHGVRLVGVPWTPDGPDIAQLEALAASHQPAMYFTQPLLHNPTGASITPARAHQVLQCAERHDFLIAEDDVYCDFHEGSATRLATLDQCRRVLYVGSTSKTLSGNLRCGFIAAHADYISSLTNIKVLTLLNTAPLVEEVVYRALTNGHYRRQTERLRAKLRDATSRSTRMLDRLGLASFTPPQGGLFAWVQLPAGVNAVELAAEAAKEQIVLAPDALFRPQGQSSGWLRLSHAYAHDIRLERFLSRALG